MDPNKTRIWQAQDLGLASARSEPSPRSASVPPPPPPHRPSRASAPPPPSRPGAFAATRIMPIERLFPGTTRAHAQATQPASPAAPRWQTFKRIGIHVLLATLTVLAVAAWKLPRAPARARLLPLQTVNVEAAAASNSVTQLPEPLAPVLTAQAPARAAAKTKVQSVDYLQRRAVELVIAGDYPGAEQAYRALASVSPDASSDAYREAARILAGKQQK